METPAGAPSTPASTPAPGEDGPLPADDPGIFGLDLRGLRRRWAGPRARTPISAEAMAGTDRRAQAFGVPAQRLMENAGTAVAAAVHALLADLGRAEVGPVLVLCGPGNNGGDGFVAARHLARHGARVIVVFVASEARPRSLESARNWDRLEGDDRITRMHAGNARDLAIIAQGIERASVVVDALLGTGVRGSLRDPIRAAVDVILRARADGVPVVAVDTPTALDLTSGDPSDPVVQADLTITFHRPKLGLLTRIGGRLAGKVLVAPIGIPPEADLA